MTHSTIKPHYNSKGEYLYFVYGYRPAPDSPVPHTTNNTLKKALAFVLVAFLVIVLMIATSF